MSSTFATSCQWVVTQYRGRSLFAQMDQSVVIGQIKEMPKKKRSSKFFFLISTRFHRVHWHINMELTASYLSSYLPCSCSIGPQKIAKLVRAHFHCQWRMIEHVLMLPWRHRYTPYQVVTQKHTNYHLQILVSARLIDTSSPPTPLLICVKFVSILPDLCRGRSHSLEDTCSR